MQLILDTCAALWISQDAALARSAAEELDDAADQGRPVYVSPILGWEIGLLVARGRLSLPMTRQAWLSRLMRAPNLRFADLPAHVLMESCFLPGEPPRDPADRIIIATAREFDLTVMTRDRLILAYAEAGHVRALEC
jgi:PIN domain nuclease of toxin-antitoxin system